MRASKDRGWWDERGGAGRQRARGAGTFARSAAFAHSAAALARTPAIAVALLAGGALAIAAIGSAIGSGPARAPYVGWSSTRGTSVRSSYLSSCAQAGGGVVYCGCLFDQITADASYSTPASFSALERIAVRAQRAHDEAAMPSVLTTAGDACSTPSVSSPASKHPI
jgi:hypothetical protein